MLAVLDYKAGNQTSVLRALEYVGVPAKTTADSDEALRCDGIIFPGVGAAPQAMEELRASGLDRAVKEATEGKVPILGICLGSQIVMEKSEEGDIDCLGLIPGVCRKFRPDALDEDGRPIKVPHMGWNNLRIKKASRLLENVDENAEFYFVHSYYVEAPEKLVIATSSHGREFCALYGEDGAWFAQFHVEKSGRAGLAMLENFYKYCAERKK
ncbi:MAG: imidazole glycerol phosphate synthase subunit HisH [Desulfovibrio sp.]|nr:imidazole glycerol phosphate synthase subunit HisH [Desulfovibrio sp.]